MLMQTFSITCRKMNSRKRRSRTWDIKAIKYFLRFLHYKKFRTDVKQYSNWYIYV